MRSLEPHLRARGVISRSVHVYGKTSTRQLHGISITVSGRGHTKDNKCELPSDKQESAYRVRKSASHVILSRILLTLHASRRTRNGDSR